MEQGGLGIGSLQDSNIVLLNKWLWRFGVEKDATWRRLVAATYGEYLHGWTSNDPEGARECKLWKNISKGNDGFLHLI